MVKWHLSKSATKSIIFFNIFVALDKCRKVVCQYICDIYKVSHKNDTTFSGIFVKCCISATNDLSWHLSSFWWHLLCATKIQFYHSEMSRSRLYRIYRLGYHELSYNLMDLCYFGSHTCSIKFV